RLTRRRHRFAPDREENWRERWLARFAIGGDSRHEAIANRVAHRVRRRVWRRRGKREMGGRFLKRVQLGAARRARRNVLHDCVALAGVEQIERHRVELGEGFFVALRDVHGASPSSGDNRGRNFSSASRILVLIVPNACPVRSAISDWLRPPKYPNSKT